MRSRGVGGSVICTSHEADLARSLCKACAAKLSTKDCGVLHIDTSHMPHNTAYRHYSSKTSFVRVKKRERPVVESLIHLNEPILYDGPFKWIESRNRFTCYFESSL